MTIPSINQSKVFPGMGIKLPIKDQTVEDGIPVRYDIAVGIENAGKIKDSQLKKDELPELKMNLDPLPDSFISKA